MNAKKIVDFLVSNEISFDTVGCYSLPKQIIERALNEFIETGKSDIIEKHKKWTYGLWNLNSIKQFERENLSLEELEELKCLKLFWNDFNDIDFIEKLISKEIERIEIAKTYRYKRRRGFTQKIKDKIKHRDFYRCNKCLSIENLEVDHIIPLIKGGSNDIDNLQTLCRSCHCIKTKKDNKND